MIISKISSAEWFPALKSYLDNRFDAIYERYLETFRYVSPHPLNKSAFSYEYSSILRDVGSVFDTVMKKIIDEEETHYDRNIGGQLKYLRDNMRDFENYRVRFNYSRKYLFPFELNKNGIPEWWNHYNSVKHDDMDSFSSGCFQYVTVGMAALYVLKHQVTMPPFQIGIFETYGPGAKDERFFK